MLPELSNLSDAVRSKSCVELPETKLPELVKLLTFNSLFVFANLLKEMSPELSTEFSAESLVRLDKVKFSLAKIVPEFVR